MLQQQYFHYGNQRLVHVSIIITILLVAYYPLFSNYITNFDDLELLPTEPSKSDKILPLPHQWTFLSTWDDDGNFLENKIPSKSRSLFMGY